MKLKNFFNIQFSSDEMLKIDEKYFGKKIKNSLF